MKTMFVTSLALSSLLLVGCKTDIANLRSGAQADEAPFGGPESVDYAAALWQQMAEDGLVGDDAILSTPYTGQHPHGAILDTIEGKTTVRGHTGDVIIKRNYGGEGVSKQAVANNPDEYLMAVTVMFRREAGYDPENQDWFWVKYAPDGSVIPEQGMKPAGRVDMCIGCHATAPGKDLVFNHDRFPPLK